MGYLSSKIPVLEDGMAREIAQMMLLQVKKQKGLTSFIHNHGINSRYLKIEEPLDIPVSKLFKIMELKALYQTDDEFINDWGETSKIIFELMRKFRKENRSKV